MNFKKVLALVLVVAMCLSMVPTYAFAEDVELWDEEEVAVADDTALEDVYLDEEPEEVIVEDEPEATEPEAVEVEEPAAEEPAAVEGLVAEETNALETIGPDAVASISGTGYETLAKAIEAATEGAYIQLRKNTSENVSIGKSISIEGDGNLKITGQIEITAGTVELIKIKTDSILITGGNLSIAAGDTGVYGTVSATSAVTGGYVMGGNFTSIPVKLLADGYVGGDDSGTDKVTVRNTTSGLVGPIGDGFVTQRETADSKVYYKNLATAIDEAAANETIKLLNDVTLANAVDVGNTNAITLDLNGKTITNGTSYGQDYLVGVKRGAKLTIADSSDPSTGAITTSTVMCAVKMTLLGENAEGTDAELTVNGGKIQGKDYGISGNGTRHGTKLTINGGTIVALEGTAIYHPQVGTLTVNGGSITGQKAGIELRSGTLNIPSTSTAQIKALASPASTTSNGNGTTTVGAAVAISQHTTKKDISVNIGGGVLEGYHALYVANPESNTGENVAVSVTGGTFTGATDKNAVVVSDTRVSNFVSGGTFSSAVPEAYCAEGYIPVKNGDSYGVKTGEFTIRVMTKGEPAATGGIGYEDIQAAITAATEGYKATSDGKVLVILSGTHAPVVPAGKCFDVWVAGGSFAPSCAETDVLFLKNNSTGATVNTVATKVETNVTVSALSTYAAKIVEGTGETALTTYYENLQDAVVYARSMDKATAKAKTIILMKTVEDEVELYGDRYVYIQKGEYSANIVGADKYAIVSDDATPVTEYFAKPAVASYVVPASGDAAAKTKYTDTFVKAATEAANYADNDGNFEVSLYAAPVLTGETPDVYKMAAAGKLTVNNATSTDILTNVYQNIVKNDGAIAITSAISGTGASVEATYTAVAAKARIDLANGKDPLYFASFQEAAQYIASSNYETYKNLVITPLANDTWTISSSWIPFEIRVANTENTITVKNVADAAVIKTPADGYTTYSFVSPIAMIDNFPTGNTDDYGNPQYETRYYATVADAVKDAGTTYAIELTRDVTADEQYELKAGEQVKFVEKYLNIIRPVKAPAGAQTDYDEATIGGKKIITFKLVQAVASVDFGTAAAPNVKYYSSFAEAAADAGVVYTAVDTSHKTVVMLEDDTTEYKLAIGSQIDVKLDGKTVNIVANNGTSGFFAIDDSTVVDGVTTYKTVVATASVVDDTGKTVFFDNLEDAVEAAAGSKIVTIYPDYDYTKGKFVARTLTYELSDNETLNVILHKQDVASRLTVISKVENKGVKTTNVPAAGSTPAYTAYTLTDAAAYVTDGEEEVYYDTFAKAAAAAVAANNATGIKTVVLLENVETDYTLPANKQINIQKGSYTVTVKPAQTTDGKFFANVETPSDDGTVINYKSVPAVAKVTTVTTVNGTATETKKYYASFEKAAEAAFVAEDTAVADAPTLEMLLVPEATDLFVPTAAGYILVYNSCEVLENISVSGTLTKFKETLTTPASTVKYSISAPVAYVMKNDGTPEYFGTIAEAASVANETHPIVLLANDLSYELAASANNAPNSIYVDKNGNDFTVTKQNPDSTTPKVAILVEDLGNGVTKYTATTVNSNDIVAYIDFESTEASGAYDTVTVHEYVYYTSFADAVEDANNGEYVITLTRAMKKTNTAPIIDETYVIESTDEIVRIKETATFTALIAPADGFAVSKEAEKNAAGTATGVNKYTISAAVAEVVADFDTTKDGLETVTYSDLKAAIDDALKLDGRVYLLTTPEGFKYELVKNAEREDKLKIGASTYKFTRDNFTVAEGQYVDGKFDGTAELLTVKEAKFSVGEGENIKYFDTFAAAVANVVAREADKPANDLTKSTQYPTSVITLYKDNDQPYAIASGTNPWSLNIRTNGYDPNLVPNASENFVEVTETETEGVTLHKIATAVASVTTGTGANATTVDYSTFKAAAEAAFKKQDALVTLKVATTALAEDDIYEMPVGTLNVLSTASETTDAYKNLQISGHIVAKGERVFLDREWIGAGDIAAHCLFTVTGAVASITKQSGTTYYYDIADAIKAAKNGEFLEIVPLTDIDVRLTTAQLTGIDAEDYFNLADSEYDVSIKAEGFEIIKNGSKNTFKAAVAYVQSDDVASYADDNTPTYYNEYFATIEDASKYASQANAVTPKTIVLLQNNTYVIKSSNEVVIAQIGDTTPNTVNSFVVTTDIEGADVNAKKISATGAAYAVWKYNVATKQTFKVDAGDGAWGTGDTAVKFKEFNAIPGASLVDFINNTVAVAQMLKTGYSVDYYVGSDGNNYAWAFEEDMTSAWTAAGYNFLPKEMPESGLTLTAHWVANDVPVYFHDVTTHVPALDATVKYDGKITEPEYEVTGWHVEGWYEDSAFTKKFDFANTTVTSEILDSDNAVRLYAKMEKDQFTVKFVTLADNAEDITETYLYGDTIPGPDTSTWKRAGYTAVNSWTYVDASGNTVAWNATDTVRDNVTLTAVWTPVQMDIYFVDGTEKVGQALSVNVGDNLTAPDVSTRTKDGYRLNTDDLWTPSFTGKVPYDESHTFVYNLNWIEQIPVSFIIDGEVYSTINVDLNSALAGNDQVPAGYKWTLKGEEYDMTKAVTEKMTLVGTKDDTPIVTEHTVTFDPDNGTEKTEVKVVSGKTVTKPADPTKEGFTFDGWFNGELAFDFTTPIDGDITLKAKWTEESSTEESGVTLAGASLELEGKIILDFYVDVAEETKASEISLVLNDREIRKPITDPDGNRYGHDFFAIPVFAKELDDKVTVQIFDAEGNALGFRVGNEVVTEFGFSVKDYFKIAPAKTADLMKALGEYGDYAKYFFENRNGTTSLNNVTPTIDAAAIAKYAAVIETENGYNGAVPAGASLVLESGTTLKVFFSGNDSDVTFTVDGAPATVTAENGQTVVLIEDIAAKDLDKNHVITASNSTGSSSITLSALTYVYIVNNSNKYSRTQKDAMIKLYDYNVAANAFFA